jgi:hypothetical protein
MKESQGVFLVVLIAVIALASAAFGAFIGVTAEKERSQREAVTVGKAERYRDANLRWQWRWKP